MPRNLIRNGTYVNIIYKTTNDMCDYSRVESEKPLIVNTQDGWTVDKVPSKGRHSVVVCTAVFGHPPRFNEWLKYQKTLGVDLVHLAAHPSFFKNATSVYPFLQEALDSGFVRIEVYDDFMGNKVFYYSQLLKYQDCAMQYAGMFEYGIFCDYDDFLNPVMMFITT